MKQFLIILASIAAVLCVLAAAFGLVFSDEHPRETPDAEDGQAAFIPRNGDIIFHTSESCQSRVIQEATGSSLSHMGIIYVQDGEALVYEAIGKMTLTPLRAWIERGVDERYTVKRLRDADTYLTTEGLGRMRAEGDALGDKEYDQCFEWSDDSIYCSELVWKIYFRALGLKVGELETLSDFDLSSPEAKKIIAKRKCRMDPDEVVISPKSMFESGLLETVYTQ